MSKRDKAKVARNDALKLTQRLTREQDELAINRWIDTLLQERLMYEIIHKKAGFPADIKISLNDVRDFLDKKNDSPDIAEMLAEGLGITLPEINVHDFRESGYEPGVLLNYLALLGWHPGGNIPERFDMDWFKSNFTIEGIGKTNAKFDRTKLLTFNGEYLQKLPVNDFSDELARHVHEPYLYGPLIDDPKTWMLFAQAYQPRVRTWREPYIAGRFFVCSTEQITYDPKAIEKVLLKNNGAGLTVLKLLEKLLQGHEDWTPPALHAMLEKFAADNNLGMGDVAQPLRVALTGTTVSPPMDLTLAILGKDETTARIERCFNVAGF